MTASRCEAREPRHHPGYYTLQGTEPVPVTASDARFWETLERYLMRTDLTPEVQVATVFLGVDQNHLRGGPPLLFETVVHGCPIDELYWRYSTWQEAEAGHASMCRLVRAALAERPTPWQALATLFQTLESGHAAHAYGLHPCPPGSLCEVCLDAPAVGLQPAPWGGDRGVCAACAASNNNHAEEP